MTSTIRHAFLIREHRLLPCKHAYQKKDEIPEYQEEREVEVEVTGTQFPVAAREGCDFPVEDNSAPFTEPGYRRGAFQFGVVVIGKYILQGFMIAREYHREKVFPQEKVEEREGNESQ